MTRTPRYLQHCSRCLPADWPSNEAGFRALIEKHVPVIFEGLAKGWLDLGDHKSIFDWLAATAGDRRIAVTALLPGDSGLIQAGGRRDGAVERPSLVGKRSVRDAFAAMERENLSPSGHQLYAQSIDIARELPELLSVARLPLDGCPIQTGEWKSWIGSGEHRGPLHYDNSENFFCLLHGQKRFTLFPFDALHDLYVGALDGGQFGVPTSVVDPRNVDDTAHPRFKQAEARALVASLEAGDVLYLPCHWWHAVESAGMNMSVNLWWREIAETNRLEGDVTFLTALVSLRTMPGHWQEYWRTLFDEFVFRRNGDPYEHLAPELQGFAGVPHPARLADLRRRRERIAANVQGSLESDEHWRERRYRLSPEARFKFTGDGFAIGREAAPRPELQMPSVWLTVLRSFAHPARAADVIDATRRQGIPDLADLDKRLRDLVGQQILIPCD